MGEERHALGLPGELGEQGKAEQQGGDQHRLHPAAPGELELATHGAG